MRARARRIRLAKGDLALIVIDYLQLMGGDAKVENRQLEVSEISRNLKLMAREFGVPIVALSQLSRNLENRGDKRPNLSDLRESGAIEQDADVDRALDEAESRIYDVSSGNLTEGAEELGTLL
ncbi:MAG: replicative DNA helicase, partial [Actinobacteria bacterium]|nr:replicative DNA helicase [Actinomycetota bacterium]